MMKDTHKQASGLSEIGKGLEDPIGRGLCQAIEELFYEMRERINRAPRRYGGQLACGGAIFVRKERVARRTKGVESHESE